MSKKRIFLKWQKITINNVSIGNFFFFFFLKKIIIIVVIVVGNNVIIFYYFLFIFTEGFVLQIKASM